MGMVETLPRKKNVSGIDEAAPSGNYLYLAFEITAGSSKRRAIHRVRFVRGLEHEHVRESFRRHEHSVYAGARYRPLGGGYLFFDEAGRTIIIGGSNNNQASILFGRELRRSETVATLHDAFPDYFVKEIIY